MMKTNRTSKAFHQLGDQFTKHWWRRQVLDWLLGCYWYMNWNKALPQFNNDLDKTLNNFVPRYSSKMYVKVHYMYLNIIYLCQYLFKTYISSCVCIYEKRHSKTIFSSSLNVTGFVFYKFEIAHLCYMFNYIERANTNSVI